MNHPYNRLYTAQLHAAAMSNMGGAIQVDSFQMTPFAMAASSSSSQKHQKQQHVNNHTGTIANKKQCPSDQLYRVKVTLSRNCNHHIMPRWGISLTFVSGRYLMVVSPRNSNFIVRDQSVITGNNGKQQ